MAFDNLTTAQQRDAIGAMIEDASFMQAQHNAAANAVTEEETAARLALAKEKRYELFQKFEALGLLTWYATEKESRA